MQNKKRLYDNEDDIGAILRNRRNEFGFSTETVAMQTKINKQIIDNLENNQFGAIGSKIYARKYLIKYAQFLNLNYKEFVSKFDDFYLRGEQSRPDKEVLTTTIKTTLKNKRPLFWTLLTIIFVIAILVSWQFFNGNSWLVNNLKNHLLVSEAKNDNSAITVEVDSKNNVNNDDIQMPSLTSLDQPEDSATAVNDNFNDEFFDDEFFNDNAANDVLPIDGEAAQELQAIQNTSEIADATQSENTSATLAQVTQDTPQVENVINSVLLVIDKENWVELRDAQNNLVQYRTFKKGEQITFALSDMPYKLILGRPQDAHLLLNGQQININKMLLDANKKHSFDISIQSLTAQLQPQN